MNQDKRVATKGINGLKTVHSDFGYEDARKGLPYRNDYETWQPHEQRNYERGRLRYAAAATLYQRVPSRQTPALLRTIEQYAKDIVPRTFRVSEAL